MRRGVRTTTVLDSEADAAGRELSHNGEESFRVTLPIPPSSNHAYTRRTKVYYKNGTRKHRVMNVLTAKAAKWMASARDDNLAAMKDCAWACQDGKIVMEVWIWWPDKRRRDVHNLFKLLCDSMEGTLCTDDKWLLVRTMDFGYDKANPRVEVVARRHSG